ncbi:MAG: ATP-binding protein [Ramlibacter sp.]
MPVQPAANPMPSPRHDRFGAVTRLSAGWYWETDSIHRLVHVAAAPLGGRPASEEAMGLTRWDQPGADRDMERWATHQAVLAQREPFQDFAIRQADPRGRMRHLLLSGEPVFSATGKFEGYRGVGHDVTARAEAEQALNASESQLAAIIDAAMDAIITVDNYHNIVVFNDFAASMFGCRRTDALSSPLVRFLPECAPALAAAGPTPPGGTAPAAVRARAMTALRQDGAAFPVEASISQIQVTGRAMYLLILRDMSARAAADKERTALETQLRESQKMEALGTMAGGIAHDFNNIVAAILGNAALARERYGDPAAVHACIDEITKAGLRARDIVQRILSFSRRQPAVFTCQPLQPVVEETVQLLRATLPPSLRITHRASRTPLLVKADASQISQVIMNLGTNAWQALGSKPGHIRILLDRQGNQARLQVCDDGCGMDADTVQRIFEPFFTTKPKGEGTGLGLPVVHGIVRAHGGRIDVYSAPGEGSTFEIFLPLAEQQDTASPALAPTAAAAGERGTGQHVVYLDDYPAMVLMVRATLQARGYRATGFEDAGAALAFIRANARDIDLVVSDYNMPEHSGLEVAREIRRLRPDLPVILASGYLTDELRESAAEAGVRGLFDKPRGIDDMCAMIAGMLHPDPPGAAEAANPDHALDPCTGQSV